MVIAVSVQVLGKALTSSTLSLSSVKKATLQAPNAIDKVGGDACESLMFGALDGGEGEGIGTSASSYGCR